MPPALRVFTCCEWEYRKKNENDEKDRKDLEKEEMGEKYKRDIIYSRSSVV